MNGNEWHRVCASKAAPSQPKPARIVAPTPEMIARAPELLAALQPVRVAVTDEERQRIYRFRYLVYVNEIGRKFGNPDHTAGTVCDADDEKPGTTLLYTEDDGRVNGTMRLRRWAPGQVPATEWHEASMGLFPGIETLTTCEIGRLMVETSQRGRLSFVSLSCAAYQLMCDELEVDLAFSYVAPGIVAHFRQAGMRTYAGRVHNHSDYAEVPMVGVLSDHLYAQNVGSFLAPFTDLFFGAGRRPPLCVENLAPVFAGDTMPVQENPAIVAERVAAAVRRGADGDRSVLHALQPRTINALSQRGFLMSLEPGHLLFEEGVRQRELFIVLEGAFEISRDSCALGQLGCGEILGASATLSSSGRRTESARAATDTVVLCVRRGLINELRQDDPASATDLHFHLARVLRAGDLGVSADLETVLSSSNGGC